MYWSAGLTDEFNGSKSLIYLLINFVFAVANAQLFRLIACIISDDTSAQPIAGIIVVLQVLFCGYIQPKSQISYGWEWYVFPWPFCGDVLYDILLLLLLLQVLLDQSAGVQSKGNYY
jgi:ABC-type multidrug transport system permease subunit